MMPHSTFSSRRSLSISQNSMNQIEEAEKRSNRAAFRVTPIIPSILTYIKRIGVGICKKKTKHRRLGPQRPGANKDGRRDRDTLDETEELEYFAEADRRHRL